MNRIILHFVYYHRGDDILFERMYASSSFKDTLSVIPDVPGGYYGTSTSYRACSFDQVPFLLSLIAPCRPLGPGSAGVRYSEGRWRTGLLQ
jgi:hypothetical protein